MQKGDISWTPSVGRFIWTLVFNLSVRKGKTLVPDQIVSILLGDPSMSSPAGSEDGLTDLGKHTNSIRETPQQVFTFYDPSVGLPIWV